MKLKTNYSLQTFTIFLIILLTGVILRVYNLEDKSYWLDEEFSVRAASSLLQDIIKGAETDTHPPLYYIILHFWIKIFDNSEISVRLLSSLFGIAAIFIMYHLGKLLFDRETGIIASLILAISTFHIAYSQEARMYSLMALLTLVSIYFFVKMMKEKSTKFVIYYVISSILLIYSHIYGVFIIILQNLYLILIPLASSKKKPDINFKQWVIIQILLLVAFLPWILVLIGQIIKIKSGAFVNISWLTPPSLLDLFNTFLLYTYYNPITLALFSLLSLSVIITWKITWKKPRKNISIKICKSEINFLLVLWLLIPIAIPYAISKLVLPIYDPKYTIAASLAFYMLTARGINKIKNKYKKGLLLVAVIFLSLSTLIYYFYFDKTAEPWREVASFIDNNANKNDLVIIEPYYTKHIFERYSKRDDIKVFDGKGDITKGINRIWFVLRYEEIDESFKKFTPIVKEEFGNITIYLINNSD